MQLVQQTVRAAAEGFQRSRLATGAVAVLLAVAGLSGGSAARAVEEPVLPSFPGEAVITNEFLPFVAGAVKVYTGREEGAQVLTVETHLKETRDFAWQGGVVTCRIIEQLEFADGVAKDRSRLYVTQSDDGAVWAFGEVEDDDSDEEDDPDEPDGWLVGLRADGDPEKVVQNAAPALLMPAAPSVGDTWTSADVAPDFHETRRVLAAKDVVRAGGRRHTRCLRIRERDVVDATTDACWFAPGVGLVRSRSLGESLALRASTIRPAR